MPTDVMATKNAWLASARDEFFAGDVQVTRGAETITIRASRGKSEFERSDREGIVTTFLSADFIVNATDYVFASQVSKPLPGDRFRVTIGLEVHVYEVLPLSMTDKPWKWTNASRLRIRAHTKRVDTE